MYTLHDALGKKGMSSLCFLCRGTSFEGDRLTLRQQRKSKKKQLIFFFQFVSVATPSLTVCEPSTGAGGLVADCLFPSPFQKKNSVCFLLQKEHRHITGFYHPLRRYRNCCIGCCCPANRGTVTFKTFPHFERIAATQKKVNIFCLHAACLLSE